MLFTRLSILSKDKSIQVIKLSDKFGIKEVRGKSLNSTASELEVIARQIGQDILGNNFLNAVLT